MEHFQVKKNCSRKLQWATIKYTVPQKDVAPKRHNSHNNFQSVNFILDHKHVKVIQTNNVNDHINA